MEKRIKMTRVEHAETIKHILGPSPAPAPKMDIDKRVVQPTAILPLAQFADMLTQQ